MVLLIIRKKGELKMATMWISVGLNLIRKPGNEYIEKTLISELGTDPMSEWLMDDIERIDATPLPKSVENLISDLASAYKSDDVLSSLGPELFSLFKSQYSSNIDKVRFIVTKNDKNKISFFLIYSILKKIINNEKLNMEIMHPIFIEDIENDNYNKKNYKDGLVKFWENLDYELAYSKDNILSIIGGLKSVTSLYYQWAMQSSNNNKILYAFNEWSQPIELLLPKIEKISGQVYEKEKPNLIVSIGTQLKTELEKLTNDKLKCELLNSKYEVGNIKIIIEQLTGYIDGGNETVLTDNDWKLFCKSLLHEKKYSQYKGMFGSEIRSITWFLEKYDINRVILLHSDLDDNSRIAKLIKNYTEYIGGDVVMVPFSQKIGNSKTLQVGMDSLLNSCVQNIKQGDLVFGVGGYKHAIALVSTHALAIGARSFYMHRDWQSPEEVYPFIFKYSKEWAFLVLKDLNKSGEEYRILEGVLWTGNGKSYRNDISILSQNNLKGLFIYDNEEKSISLSGMGKIVRKILINEFDNYEKNIKNAERNIKKLNMPKRKRENVIVGGGIHEGEYSNKCSKLFLTPLLFGIEKLRGSKKDLTGLIELSQSNINRLVKIIRDSKTGIIDLNLYCHLPYKSEFVKRFNHIIYSDGLNTLYRNYFIGIFLKNELIKNMGFLDYK